MKRNSDFLNVLLFYILFLLLQSCSNSDNNNDQIIIDSTQKNISIQAAGATDTIIFNATSSWIATVDEKEGNAWMALNHYKGIAGVSSIILTVDTNSSEIARTATIVLAAGNATEKITVTQETALQTMQSSDVTDFNKYYKPKEFDSMNMLRSDAKWSWFRSKQSEHFFVFWETGFGTNPNAESVPEAYKVDIDDLLEKAEEFYNENINVLKFATIGSGVSYLDKYKMQIYISYTQDWVAYGGGYDDVIGALWVSPSTLHPVGSVIAHEIGHSFQYQTYADLLYANKT